MRMVKEGVLDVWMFKQKPEQSERVIHDTILSGSQCSRLREVKSIALGLSCASTTGLDAKKQQERKSHSPVKPGIFLNEMEDIYSKGVTNLLISAFNELHLDY